MLAIDTVRMIAAFMAVAIVAMTVLFARWANPFGGRHREVRAVDDPPRALQLLWEAINVALVLYPFSVALVPDLVYGGPLSFTIPYASVAQVAAFLAVGLAGGLLLWSARTLGRFMIVEISVSVDHQLVTRGPYAYVRHPTYAGLVLFAIGQAILFLSLPLLVLAVLAAGIANYRAAKEERLLSSMAGFGETYRAYAARTGRFVPRVRKPS